MLIKKVLLDELDQRTFIPIITAFTPSTNDGQVSDILESKFEKRRKGIQGPENGKCNIIFIDDLNMPQIEQFGEQPPFELIRQRFISQGQGWYDKKQLEFKTIMDIQFCAAMQFGRPSYSSKIDQTSQYDFYVIFIRCNKYIQSKQFEYRFDEYVGEVKLV